MHYWQAVYNEFYNRYARDYAFSYTMMRYYPEDDNQTTQPTPKRTKYFFNDEESLYLTQREADCIYHMCKGLTIKETAEELLLSPRSIEFYLKRIKERFGIQYKKDLLTFIENHPQFPAFYTLLEEEFNA